jgi:cell division protein FtsI/penicillin-binding protein 2
MDSTELIKIFSADDYMLEIYDNNDINELTQYILEHRNGNILAHVSTPVVKNNSFTWGYTYNKYFLATTVEDIVNQAIAWKESIK